MDFVGSETNGPGCKGSTGSCDFLIAAYGMPIKAGLDWEVTVLKSYSYRLKILQASVWKPTDPMPAFTNLLYECKMTFLTFDFLLFRSFIGPGVWF